MPKKANHEPRLGSMQRTGPLVLSDWSTIAGDQRRQGCAMSQRHIIENAAVELSFTSEDAARSEQSGLSEFVNSRLMAAVERVFDEVSDTDQVFRIDHLDVDLGSVPYPGYQEELVARLEEQLRAALHLELGAIFTSPELGDATIAPEERDLEQLEHFLQSGTMLWHFDLGPDQTIDQLMQRVARENISGLVQLLRSYQGGQYTGAVALQRLVNQFSDATLAEIAGILTDFPPSFFLGLVEDFRRLWRGGPFVTTTERGFSNLLWRCLLGGALSAQSLPWDRMDLIERILDRLDGSPGTNRNAVRTTLSMRDGDLPSATLVTRELAQLITGLPKSAANKTPEVGTHRLRPPAASNAEGETGKTSEVELPTPVPSFTDSTPVEPHPHTAKAASETPRATDHPETGSGIGEPPVTAERHGEPNSRGTELTDTYAGKLVNLCQQLLSGELTPEQVVDTLPPEELGPLIQAFLSVAQAADDADPSILVQAVDTYAGSAQDLRAYYQQVLECLTEERIIDFEAILAASHTPLEADLRVDGNGGEQPQIPYRKDEGSSLSTAAADASGRPTAGSPLDRPALPIPEDSTPDALVTGLLTYLREGRSLDRQDSARLIAAVENMLVSQPARLRQLLEHVLEIPEASHRIIQLLPEAILSRLLLLLRPSEHHQTLLCADVLADAFRDASQEHGFGVSPRQVSQLKWRFIFKYLLEEGLPFDEATFVEGFTDFLAGATDQLDSVSFRAILSQQVALNTLPATREQHQSIIGALDRDGSPEEVTATDHVPPETGPRGWEIAGLQSDEATIPNDGDIIESIYIANAGQIMAAPYLQRLFAMLDLTEGPAFKDPTHAERAVHLLQFMVNESTDSPEYQLVLNKILCGVRVGQPIEREIAITDGEKEAIEGLIQGMIQNWRAIGNTSSNGFRESFLQREGRLQLQNDAWHLLVEARPFDMLLDSIPWSFSTVKFPWMDRIIYVEWR